MEGFETNVKELIMNMQNNHSALRMTWVTLAALYTLSLHDALPI